MNIETILYADVLDTEQSLAISSDDLITFWKSVAPDYGYAAFGGERIFMQTFEQLADLGVAKNDLELGRGWTINLKAGIVKAALSGAYLAAILEAVGIVGVPAMVVPAIIPFLFEISQIKFTKKEKTLHAELVRTATALQHWTSPNNLYALLDDDTRSCINQLDFLDFMEKLSDAGLADSSADGRYLLKPDGKEVFRLKMG